MTIRERLIAKGLDPYHPEDWPWIKIRHDTSIPEGVDLIVKNITGRIWLSLWTGGEWHYRSDKMTHDDAMLAGVPVYYFEI